MCIVFEGRDTAGKGGVIKGMSPRDAKVVALPTPSEREKSQMYSQRHVPHLPAGGEIVIFDRSWYMTEEFQPQTDQPDRCAADCSAVS